jgi:hypothetical protein
MRARDDWHIGIEHMFSAHQQAVAAAKNCDLRLDQMRPSTLIAM